MLILTFHAGSEGLVLPLRRFTFAPLALAVMLAGAACGGHSSASITDGPDGGGDANATPDALELARAFHGFIYPIAGGCLPKRDSLMPNAPRPYRGGLHEGVDFYDSDNCTHIENGTPVLAAKDGVVIRADHDYHDLTPVELQTADERIQNGGANDFEVVDLFRGRQVWVDHGDGIITRYGHLSAIADDIRPGVPVAQGQTLAFVGESGTPESMTAPGTELHLHWEVRTGDAYLGEGQPAADVRATYLALFEAAPDR